MLTAPLPSNEAQRLESLRQYAILDTPPEDSFERIIALAIRLFDVPIAFVSLVDQDRQWFKSCHGLNVSQTGRDISFCSHAILSNEVMLVNNALEDTRFADNPLVTGYPNVRFYAGAPLQTPGGFNLGALGLFDTVPRNFSQEQQRALADLAALVVDELEWRRTVSLSRQNEQDLAKNARKLSAAYAQVSLYVDELSKEIEERTQTEAKLRRQTSELQAIFEIFPDLFFRFDTKGLILDYHASSMADLYLPPENFLGRRAAEVLPSDVAHKLETTILQALQTGSLAATEYSLLLPHGEQSFEARLLPLFNDQVVAVIRNVTEQKQARELLRQSEERFRRLSEASFEGLSLNEQGILLDANQVLADLFGYSFDEIIGLSIFDLTTPESHSLVLENVERGSERPYEVVGLKKDGSTFPIEAQAKTMIYQGRRIRVSAVRDITERKKAEQALRESENKYRTVVDNVKEVIFQTDPAGAWRFLNRAWQEITGFSIAETLGANFLDYIHPDDRSRNQDLFRAFLEGEIEYYRSETRYLTKGGGFCWLEVYAQLILAADGSVLGTLGTLNDITDRKRAERALLTSETRFRTLATHAPVGIFQSNARGECTFVNKHLCEIMGLSPAETLGDGWIRSIHPDDRDQVSGRWYAAAQARADFVSEHRFLRPDGHSRWSFVNATPLYNEAMELSGYLGTVIDITERKQAEGALAQRVAQMALINDMSGKIAAVLDLDTLLDRVAQLIQKTFGYHHVALFLLDKEAAYLKAVAGSYTGYFPPGHCQQLSQGIIGWVATHGQKIVANDVNAESLYISLIADNTRTRAELCLPINLAGQTIGILDIQSPQLNTFSDNDVLAMETMVDQIAVAIENARLYQAVQQELAERKKAEEALQQSEAQNRALLDAIPDLMFRLNREGTYLDFRAEQDIDLLMPPESVIGTNIANTPMPPEGIEQMMAAIGRALETGQIQGIEYSAPLSRGLQIFEARLVAGGKDEVVAIVRNITERKQAELLERDRNRVLEMVTQNQPLEATLTELAQLVERQRPEMLASVVLLRDGQVYHGAAPHLPQTFTQAVDDLPIHQIVNSQGSTVYRGETTIVSDIANTLPWNEYQELALSHGLLAYWSMPIYSSDGAMLGVFTSYYRRPNSPTEADLELVKMAGRLAAIAIEQRQLADQLTYQAQHDALTGLPNRLLFRDRLQQAIVYARQHKQLAGLLYIDLDRFKLINDTLGHAAGDRLLYQVTQRLQSCIRPGDTLARMGGDEFTVVLSGLEEPQGAIRVAQRILEACKAPFHVVGHDLFVTTSIGLSFYPTDGDNTEELMRKADQALYRSKDGGKNTYQLYTSVLDNVALKRLSLENQLRGAVGRAELVLYYQPQIEINTGRLVGLEALLRWRHPELGLVLPASFISLAEESGLIIPIGAWVIQEACRQNRAWQKAGYPALKVAVNVSTLQFAQADFVETVAHALYDSGLDPCWLQLELTESLLMHNHPDTAAKLAELRRLGVTIAIDDFGTGYSSLAYLRQLPIDALKIAQPFVREIGVDLKNTPNDLAIVTAVTNLAHSLGMGVIAEGVETEEQLAFLNSIGCNEMQGYLISHPLPVHDLEALLNQEAGSDCI